jgi:hypothetical protein
MIDFKNSTVNNLNRFAGGTNIVIPVFQINLWIINYLNN